MKYTKEEVLQYVREEDVKFIRLAFCDIYGKQKNISVMPGELPRAFADGIAFDASAIRGFGDETHSDLMLHPDPATLAVLPWRPEHGRVIRMFCTITYPDGRAFECDTRSILIRAVEDAKKCGVAFDFGPELEFYLFRLDEHGNRTDTPYDDAGYMDHTRGVLAGNDLWLTPTAAAANIDMSNNAIAYAGRMAVKNVLYTMVDTYNTAVEYAAGGGEGGVDLNATTAASAAFSPLFMFLWVLLDAIFIIGALLCGLFIFLKVRKRLRINAEIEAGTYSPRKNERSSARSAKNEVEMRLREYDPDWYEYK